MLYTSFFVTLLGLTAVQAVPAVKPSERNVIPVGRTFTPQPTAAELKVITESLELGIVNSLTATITAGTLITGQVSASFIAKNPVPLDITLLSVSAKAGVNGTEYASFNHKFSPGLNLTSYGTANSGTFGGVSLTKGALGSLPILSLGYLDLQSANLSLLLYGHIPLNLTDITQQHVNATYNIGII